MSTNNNSALLIIDVQNDFLPPSGSLAVPDGQEIIPILRKLLAEEVLMEDVWNIVVASQDWHPQTHISFSSHYKHPHARPFTTIKVPKGVLGEHYEFLPEGDLDEGNDRGFSSGIERGLKWTDPNEGYTKRSEQGVDDGQVDLNLWPDHCIQKTYGAEIQQDVKEALRPWHRAGKFALVRKGTNANREAFSAFSGTVMSTNSPEISSTLGLPSTTGDGDGDVRPTGSGDRGSEQGGDLADFLVDLGVNKVCVVGLATDFCVAQTALAAINKPSSPFSVYLYRPAVRGVRKASSELAFRACEDRGIKVLETEEEIKEVFGKRTI